MLAFLARRGPSVQRASWTEKQQGQRSSPVRVQASRAANTQAAALAVNPWAVFFGAEGKGSALLARPCSGRTARPYCKNRPSPEPIGYFSGLPLAAPPPAPWRPSIRLVLQGQADGWTEPGASVREKLRWRGCRRQRKRESSTLPLPSPYRFTRLPAACPPQRVWWHPQCGCRAVRPRRFRARSSPAPRHC